LKASASPKQLHLNPERERERERETKSTPSKLHRHHVKAGQRSRPSNQGIGSGKPMPCLLHMHSIRIDKQTPLHLSNVRVYTWPSSRMFARFPYTFSRTPNLDAGVSSPLHLPSSVPERGTGPCILPFILRVPVAPGSSLQIDLLFDFVPPKERLRTSPDYLAH
jgi:hypothetical protein